MIRTNKGVMSRPVNSGGRVEYGFGCISGSGRIQVGCISGSGRIRVGCISVLRVSGKPKGS